MLTSAEFSQMKTLELWYRTMTAEELIAGLSPELRKRVVKRIEKEQVKSRGEELFQPASDLFLGWSRGRHRDFFFRQLRDMKIGPLVETFGKSEMSIYAQWCGSALALSHARSGSSAVLSGYMGTSDTFEKAIASYSFAYADQNEKDHAALMRAIKSGKVEALFEEGG